MLLRRAAGWYKLSVGRAASLGQCSLGQCLLGFAVCLHGSAFVYRMLPVHCGNWGSCSAPVTMITLYLSYLVCVLALFVLERVIHAFSLVLWHLFHGTGTDVKTYTALTVMTSIFMWFWNVILGFMAVGTTVFGEGTMASVPTKKEGQSGKTINTKGPWFHRDTTKSQKKCLI
eukprot:3546269-Rhodomonas_salina.1